MGRRSKWIKSGWYLAVCLTCCPARFMPFPDFAWRNEWAAEHERRFRHYVDCIDGE